MKKLHQLGAFLTDKEATGPLPISSSAELSPLRPQKITTSHEPGIILKLGEFPSTPIQPTNKPTAKAVLQQWAHGLTVERTSFKIIKIDLLDPTHARTKVMAGLYGIDSEGRKGEHHGTWIIDWDISTPSPVIQRWKAVRYSANYANPIFKDVSGTLFSKAPDAWRQLRTPAPEWLSQMSNEVANTQNFYQGIAVADINGDGLEDVFICQGDALPNRMLLQLPNGEVSDITKSAGLDLLDRTRAAVFGDLDNDGDADLILATKKALLIYSNDGSGKFSRQHALMNHFPSLFSLSLADYDRDGRLDFYVCSYFKKEHNNRFSTRPSPNLFHDASNGGENKLFRNTSESGNIMFQDVTSQVGLNHNNHYFSLACSWNDYDDDGDLDLYIANDFGKNQFFRNDDGQFVDVIDAAGLQDQNFSMNATWGDWNRDGRSDLYVSNMFSSAGMRVTFQKNYHPGTQNINKQSVQHLSRGNSLFTQESNARFDENSSQQGVWLGRWAWAARFADVDHNGWQDLMVTNGYLTGRKKDDL